MKIADVKPLQEGKKTISYLNGYTFTGDVDKNGSPTCGTITAPDGQKYFFANLEGKDIFDVFESVEKGDCDNNLVMDI